MKHFISYFFCIALAVFIAYYITGSGGLMITAILALALLFSWIILLYMSKKIQCSVICSDGLVSKGDTVTVQVRMKKSSWFPTPFIELELEPTAQLKAQGSTFYRLALSTMRYEDIKVAFTAQHCGLSSVKIKQVQLVDFLGIFRRKIKDISDENTSFTIRILPNIPDVCTQKDILKTTSESASFDDSEEETSETALSATGSPGYDHRVYVPGDSLKRINWKMSSKRDIYMVRLDEKIAVTSQCFVLDCPKFSQMSENDYKNLDIIIEGSLAMLSMLISQGLETYYYYYQDSWKCVDVKNYADLLELQEQLSWYAPNAPAQRVSPQALDKGGVVFFTAVDAAHEAMAFEIFALKDSMFIVHENSGFSAAVSNLWSCSQDFEFKRIV